jgi:hypothetical protein
LTVLLAAAIAACRDIEFGERGPRLRPLLEKYFPQQDPVARKARNKLRRLNQIYSTLSYIIGFDPTRRW